MKTLLFLLPLVYFLSASCLFAQNEDPKEQRVSSVKLEGYNSIYLLTGVKMNSSSSANASLSDVKAESNFQLSLGYQYWFTEEWAVNASVGLFSAEADVKYTNVSAISIIPVLFGFSYYPEVLALGKTGRAHLGLNAGAYIGSATQNNLSLNNFGSSAVSETVFGVEPNAGIDFIVSNWLKIGPSISYHFVSQFNEVIGKRKNYSGPVFSLNIGLLL